MRFYSLKIDNKEFSRLDANNPSAIRITFDLKQYGDTIFPYGVITLYNVSQEWFKNLPKVVGKKIELYASIKEDALIKKIGMGVYENNLIAYGYVGNFIFNPLLNAGNSVSIIMTSSSLTNDNSKGFLMKLKIGDNIKEKVKEALGSVYSDTKIEVTGLSILSKYNENIIINNFSDASKFLEKHDIDIKRVTYGFEICDKNRQNSSKITELLSMDFLEQPRQINVNTIQASLNLRGDLKLNSIIRIPEKLFSQFDGGSTFYFTENKVFITGVYQIVKIWHIGDSRNISPQSWATNIEAVKYDN